jgi:hypothetical protein
MRKLAIIVPLLALLAGTIWFAISQWEAVDFAAIPGWGYAAMALGGLFSLVVGGGLMALVFYSARHGYDEAAGGERRREE